MQEMNRQFLSVPHILCTLYVVDEIGKCLQEQCEDISTKLNKKLTKRLQDSSASTVRHVFRDKYQTSVETCCKLF